MNALGIGNVPANTHVREKAILIDGFKLQPGDQIGERVGAREELRLVAPQESAHVDHGVRADDMSPGRSHVEGSNLCALIGLRKRASERIENAGLERIVGVGFLEPGASVVQVQLQGVGIGNFIIRAIEDIFLIALVVKRGEFRRIKKAARAQAIGRDEVAPFGSTEGNVEAGIHGAKRAIRSREASRRLRHTQTRARRRLDHQAGLISKFRWRGTGNDFQRLDGIRGNLIRKDLALLVGDGLAIERK